MSSAVSGTANLTAAALVAADHQAARRLHDAGMALLSPDCERLDDRCAAVFVTGPWSQAVEAVIRLRGSDERPRAYAALVTADADTASEALLGAGVDLLLPLQASVAELATARRTLLRMCGAERVVSNEQRLMQEVVLQVKNELRDAEDRYHTLVETMHEGLGVVDAKGRLTFANARLAAIYRRQRGAILGRRLAGFSEHLAVAEDTAPREIELGASPGELVVTISPEHILDSEGSKVGSFGVVTDITERKRAERDLREERATLEARVAERTAELQRANEHLADALRHKDTFLASMSHELRTPLNAILGICQTLHAQVCGPLNEKQLSFLETLATSGKHLLALINDILDVAKVEVGRLELERQPVMIEALCKSSLQFVRQIAAEKGLRVELRCRSSAQWLVADERRLKQILVNLLSNAIKFTLPGGEVLLDVTDNPEQETVSFEVRDNGIGIEPRDLQHLFTPFVQLDASMSRRAGGSGLGLTLVQRLTRLHGGDVKVDSKLGRGSSFTVTLPRNTSAPLTEPAATEPPLESPLALGIEAPRFLPFATSGGDAPAARGRVLLAEDNAATVEALVEYLHAKGFVVDVAPDGRTAIERALAAPPDVILMDVQLPLVDGLEATRTLRSHQELARTPIIAVTAHAMPEDRARCKAAGATDYLTKPVDYRKLVDTVDRCLRESPVREHAS